MRVKALCSCFGKNSNFADQTVLLFIVYSKEEELAPVKASLFLELTRRSVLMLDYFKSTFLINYG